MQYDLFFYKFGLDILIGDISSDLLIFIYFYLFNLY